MYATASLTYAIPIFNFFHIAITAVIPLIILMCFSIKLFEKSPKNTMLFIVLCFTMVNILFSILISQSQQEMRDEMNRWETLGTIENAIINGLIIITVIWILFDKYKMATLFTASALLFMVVIDFYIWESNVLENNMYYIPEYSCIGVTNKELKDVLEVNKYILQKEKEGNNVYVLDIIASKYMIPLHRNNYKYDLLMNGNFGHNGEAKLIEEIKSIENILILRQKPEVETLSIQQPKNIDNLIEKNYIKIGEINNLEIFN